MYKMSQNLQKVAFFNNMSHWKAIKQWGEIQNFIKFDIYSPKMTYSEVLKSAENYIESGQ